jgi:hypothetical protein
MKTKKRKYMSKKDAMKIIELNKENILNRIYCATQSSVTSMSGDWGGDDIPEGCTGAETGFQGPAYCSCCNAPSGL